MEKVGVTPSVNHLTSVFLLYTPSGNGEGWGYTISPSFHVCFSILFWCFLCKLGGSDVTEFLLKTHYIPHLQMENVGVTLSVHHSMSVFLSYFDIFYENFVAAMSQIFCRKHIIYPIWEWRRSGLHCLSIIQHLPDTPKEICSTNATDYPWDLRVSVWKKWGTSLCTDVGHLLSWNFP
jgi:hypothetical protein